MKGSTQMHQELVDKILLALARSGRARVWKNVVGRGRALHDPKRIISFGLVGSCDITGIRDDGKRIELEVKTGQAVQTVEQIAYGRMISQFHGIHAVCRSVDDALRAVLGD